LFRIENPVTLPPGRARLATKPAATASVAKMTIGVVLVACLAARAAGVPPPATMTSAFKRRSSAKNPG
jgi:hypothetical protein